MTIFVITESSRTIKIGYDIAGMEKELKRLLDENKKLAYESNRLRTSEGIALSVKNMKLNLVMVDSDESLVLARNFRKYRNEGPQKRIIVAQSSVGFNKQDYSLE